MLGICNRFLHMYFRVTIYKVDWKFVNFSFSNCYSFLFILRTNFYILIYLNNFIYLCTSTKQKYKHNLEHSTAVCHIKAILVNLNMQSNLNIHVTCFHKKMTAKISKTITSTELSILITAYVFDYSILTQVSLLKTRSINLLDC